MSWVWIGCLGAGVLLLIVALILSVVWKIPTLLDELSGRKAKRQIERMRNLNIDAGTLEVIATDDFYRTVDAEEIGFVPTHIPKGESGSSGGGLNSMLDNPYESVLKETGVAPNLRANLERRQKAKTTESLEEMGTSEDEGISSGAHKVVVLKEQSSLR